MLNRVIFFNLCPPLFLLTVDRTSIHYGHTAVASRPMDWGDALGVDSIVFEHGVHYERFDGGRRKVQSKENCHLNDQSLYLYTPMIIIFVLWIIVFVLFLFYNDTTFIYSIPTIELRQNYYYYYYSQRKFR